VIGSHTLSCDVILIDDTMSYSESGRPKKEKIDNTLPDKDETSDNGNDDTTEVDPVEPLLPEIEYLDQILYAHQATTITPSVFLLNGQSVKSCVITPALPSWASINAQSCVLSGTPDAYLEATGYTVTLTDNLDRSVTTTFNIHVRDIVRDGLVVHLDSANTASYPGTGQDWFDLSGQNNHFNKGGGTFADGVMSFSGGSTYAYRNGLSYFANAYTIESWIKSTQLGDPTSNCGDFPTTIWCQQGNGDTDQWIYKGHCLFTWPNDANAFASLAQLRFVANSTVISESTYSKTASIIDFPVNEYALITTVYKTIGSEFQLLIYKNGVLASTSGTLHTIFAHPLGQLRVGGRNNNCGAGSFIGALPIFRMYSRAFEVDEIQRNYQAQSSRFDLLP
jgi:hypothetical protein